MATVDEKTKEEVEKKAKLYEAAKEKVISRIRENIRIASDKLREAERELLDDVEIEFGNNPFMEFLASGNRPNVKVKTILSKEIPTTFGPDEESFHSLFKEIDSLKMHRKKPKRMLFDLIPQNIKPTNVTYDTISISWDDAGSDCFYEVELRSLASVKLVFHTKELKYDFDKLKSGAEYHIRVRTIMLQDNNKSTWSNPVIVRTKFRLPEGIQKEHQENNTSNVINTNNTVNNNSNNIINNTKKMLTIPNDVSTINKTEDGWKTFMANRFLSINELISWNIKLIKSKRNNGSNIYIGVAQSDINQEVNFNHGIYGWYFYCYESTLLSGPPHNYRYEYYGPRKEKGEYVHIGDSVGVVMDTTKGRLSFSLNGVNLGVAYEGIPLDKPLASCNVLYWRSDFVELHYNYFFKTDSWLRI